MDLREHFNPETKKPQEALEEFRAKIEKLKHEQSQAKIIHLRDLRTEELLPEDMEMYKALEQDKITREELAAYRKRIPQEEKSRHDFASYLNNIRARRELLGDMKELARGLEPKE